jgi:microcystin-dependent protein
VSDQFVGEIRAFPFNFAPLGWAMCNGQILSISQNTALFSLLGTFYGGNGTSNFALPNLQGSAPLDQGQGVGLTNRMIGETGGEQAVTLLLSEIPSHTHQATGVAANGDQVSPVGNTWATAHSGPKTKDSVYSNSASAAMNAQALAAVGSSQPHDNMPPYLVLNFCIALIGIFPARG